MTELQPSPTGPVGALPPLTPDRDTRGALSQLVEVLLDKGVYLDLDLLVTVAEVPLIAVNLRATIAGVETMIRYGLYEPSPASAAEEAVSARDPEEDAAVVRDTAWYREPRAGEAVWREGTLTVARSGDVRWQGKGDRRASLRLTGEEILGVTTSPDTSSAGRSVLDLRTASGTAQLAGADADRWAAALREGAQDGAGEEVRR